MNDGKEQLALLAAIITLTLACGACAGSTPRQEESSSLDSLPELHAGDEIFNVSNSNKDRGDSYASAVLVLVSGSPECSGVIVHPKLVLTAGHCVCRERENKNTITLDSLACEESATIIAIAYSKKHQRPYIKSYTGAVRPHRDFKAVLQKKKLRVSSGAAATDAVIDETGAHYVTVNAVAESRADLALISLTETIDNAFPVTPLSRTTPRVREPVVVVGYGADSVRNGIVEFTDKHPTRRFGKNIIAQNSGEKFMLESPGALALPGDSGGPCFRVDASGVSLVGISSRSSPGRRATFTNTHHYLKWLEAEIAQADRF